MKLFLTSTIGGSYREYNENKEEGERIPCELISENHFLEHLSKNWPTDPKCLMISSDPENTEMNDYFKNIYKEAFKLSNFELTKIDVCDKRNENMISTMINKYNILILSGGHVPTENKFFKRIHLKELIKNYDGTVICVSAGTMNCADIVYAQPELEGEAIDPNYQRYLDGLGLTSINILPHFQDIKELSVDGLRILEDISLSDSQTRPIYALVDGSFILVDNNKSTLYGEAYLIKDKVITKICEIDKNIYL